MAKNFIVKLWNDTGIPDALRKYCADCGITVNAFANKAIAEKLQRMDVHSMTIAEIEDAERRWNDGKR